MFLASNPIRLFVGEAHAVRSRADATGYRVRLMLMVKNEHRRQYTDPDTQNDDSHL